ncbi:hypothetical protein ATI61_103522 [Archangium gephyra]|uniref:Uncharacterized protein n=2 Tax=Archangium gephyra TaxID=48 RepID=A0ABX9K748_9BACT|nr:hypothetical protein [Archangium gephyra]REG34616.1 hypothetical protein ATI61_103522 [Archangium gephyra]
MRTEKRGGPVPRRQALTFRGLLIPVMGQFESFEVDEDLRDTLRYRFDEREDMLRSRSKRRSGSFEHPRTFFTWMNFLLDALCDEDVRGRARAEATFVARWASDMTDARLRSCIRREQRLWSSTAVKVLGSLEPRAVAANDSALSRLDELFEHSMPEAEPSAWREAAESACEWLECIVQDGAEVGPTFLDSKDGPNPFPRVPYILRVARGIELYSEPINLFDILSTITGLELTGEFDRCDPLIWGIAFDAVFDAPYEDLTPGAREFAESARILIASEI